MNGRLEEWQIVQILDDAGCNEQTVAAFIDGYRKGLRRESLLLLESVRSELLSEIHKDNGNIEFLDELMHSIRRGAQQDKKYNGGDNDGKKGIDNKHQS